MIGRARRSTLFPYTTLFRSWQARILEEALEREVSPSDEVLQRGLDVGRPRLSQLFNGMLRAGVLTVRRQGRSRLYRISEQARDHLYRLGKDE